MRNQNAKLDWFDYVTIAVILLCLLGFVLVITGCTSTTVTKGDITVKHSRMMWQTGRATVGYAAPDGTRFDLTLENSRADAEAAGTIAERTAYGMARGMKGQ